MTDKLLKVGEWYKFADESTEISKEMAEISLEDCDKVSGILEKMNPLMLDAGVGHDDLKFVNFFVKRVKLNVLNTQEGEQKNYEHTDEEYPQGLKKEDEKDAKGTAPATKDVPHNESMAPSGTLSQ
jgi:hypothetical protein